MFTKFLSRAAGRGGLALALSCGASAQSFNLDLDIFFGSPAVGNGAPAPGFPGAAGQPGFWNRVYLNDQGPTPLVGLDGLPTNVVYTAEGGLGGGIGFNNPSNTGDYALLLNDAAQIGYPLGYNAYVFTGLTPGPYRVFTYAVRPSGTTVNASVYVPGSTSANPQVVTGPMPGNAFQYLITHAIHDVSVDSVLTVRISGPWIPGTYVNGFQIVAVPEPAGAISVSLGILLFLRRKKRPNG